MHPCRTRALIMLQKTNDLHTLIANAFNNAIILGLLIEMEDFSLQNIDLA